MSPNAGREAGNASQQSYIPECVCVCVRERERERERLHLYIWCWRVLGIVIIHHNRELYRRMTGWPSLFYRQGIGR